jgi:uncharacterized HAD superfamily protein/adenine/guanine phosphoribosyltransferase-like PRPP-binding protein
MNFISLDQFYKDVVTWERQLPYFDAVCGVPRSGLFPASIIALRRNIRLVDLNSLLQDPNNAIQSAPIRQSNPIIKYNKRVGNRLLVVDDSASNQTTTISAIREALKSCTSLDISYAAVYRASSASTVDHYFKEVPLPRMFGWNWFRHWELQFALLDIDGVLCEDWALKQEQDDDPVYLNHLMNVKPLYIPDVPVLGLVTSRLSRYRELTETWLKKHQVMYRKLHMHPATTPEQRRSMNDHAQRKADVYIRTPEANLFVESDMRQAQRIFELTKKPVLCIDTMTCLS